MNCWPRDLWTCWNRSVCWICLLVATCQAQGDSPSAQSPIDRLIAAGKFDEAELYCRESLSNRRLALDQRVTHVVELIHVLTEHARVAPAEKRATLLATAQQEAENYLRDDSRSCQRLLVAFQLAVLPSVAAELRSHDFPTPDATRQLDTDSPPAQIRSALRESSSRLEQLADQVDAELREHGRRDPREEGHLTQRAMRALRARIGLELAITRRRRAERYPPGSEDRLLAASQAIRELEKLAPTSMDDRWWRASRHELLRALRLKSDWNGLSKQIKALNATRLTSESKGVVLAELIRAAIAQANWQQLTQLVAGLESVPPQADSDWARLEGYLALAQQQRQAGNETGANDWGKQAVELIESRSAAYPTYWRRRAQALVAASASSGSAVEAIQTQAAESLLRQGRLRESLASYGKILPRLSSDDQAIERFQIARTMAGIEIKLGKERRAAQRLAEAAIQLPKHPAASATHHTAVALFANAANNRDAHEDDQQTYELALRRHLETWPNSPHADTHRWWLGMWLHHRKEWFDAIAIYQAVSSRFEPLAEVIGAQKASLLALRAADRYMAETARANALAEASVARFEQIGTDPLVASQTRLAATLAAMEVALLYKLADSTSIRDLSPLERQLNSLPPDDPSRGEAIAVAAAAKAAQADYVSAREYLESLDAEATDAWRWLWQLTKLQGEGDRTWADWKLRILERAAQQNVPLSAEEQVAWDRDRAITLVMAGRHREAISRLQSLLQDQPRDAVVAESLAVAWSEEKDPQALQAWRRVARLRQPESEEWYRAKFEIARSLVQIGDTQRAIQMIDLLVTLHPQMGNAATKRRFQNLRSQLVPASTTP